MKYLLYWFTRNRQVLDIEIFSDVRVTTRFPLWITLILAVLGIALAIYLYRRAKNLTTRRRRILTTLRALVHVSLLFLLAGPMLEIEGDGRPAGPMPVVVDRTKSMSTPDIAEQPRLRFALNVRQAIRDNADKGLGLKQIHYL